MSIATREITDELSYMGITHAYCPMRRAASEWLYVVPWGLRKLLNWIRTTYNNPVVYITENGFSDHGQLDDSDRIDYYKQYIAEAQKGEQR